MDGKIFYSMEEGINFVKHGWFYLAYKNILFPIFIDIKDPNIDKYVIFVPGSMRRGKPLPIFQRSYFSKDIKANVISLADPTLFFRKNITMGWFCGDSKYHYASLIGRIMFLYFNKFNIKNVVVYGTSAGGIPSLHIANELKNCICYIGNAQLNVFNYYENHKQRLFENCFPGLTQDQIKAQYGKRLNLNGLSNQFILVATQNICDMHHYEKHFLPFIQFFKKQNEAYFFTYKDEKSGHDVLPKETELSIIEFLLKNEVAEVLYLLPDGSPKMVP